MLISQFPGSVYFGSAAQRGPKRLDEYHRDQDSDICRGEDLASWRVDRYPDVVVRSAIDPGYSKGEDDPDGRVDDDTSPLWEAPVRDSV